MLYNVDFGIAGTLFLAVYFFFLKTQFSTNIPSNKRFCQQILSIMFACGMDVVTAITISYSEAIPLWINYALNVVYFCLVGLTGYMLPVYINSLMNPGGNRKPLDKINIYILAIYWVLCITSPFTRIMFCFDSNKHYMRGKLYLIVFFLPYLYMLETLVRVMVNRARFRKKQLASTVFFMIVSSMGGLTQLFVFPNVLLSYFFIAIACVVLLFSFETPDYQNLVRVTEDLRKSQESLENARAKEVETTRIIHELMKSANWKIEFNTKTHELISSYWSPEFRVIIGKDENDETSDSDMWLNALHPDDKAKANNSFYRGMFGAKPFDEIYRLKDKSGEYRWYRGTGEVTVDEESGITIYQGIIQDVDTEKNLAIMSEEKEQALIKAQEANSAKSRFLSNMSHDIRTPMNAIVGFTDLALENVNDSGKVKEYLEKIQVSGNHLLLLINDILDMSRIESGKVSIELIPCNLIEVFDGIKKIIEGQAQGKSLDININLDGIRDANVICDKLHLNQVLLNCIGNSVKFTPEGGSISVMVDQHTSNESGKAEYCIYIADTGIGMSKEFLKHIFDPFERERTSTISRTQGTGLGMTITKSLVDLMGGTIDVESREGEGTTYIINLTLEIQLCYNEFGVYIPREEEAMEEILQFLKGKNMLLVDDNATNRMLARGVLNSKGMTCDEAEDGAAAVAKVEGSDADRFDLILMDIQMPVMNGYEAADRIRQLDDPKKNSIPIIAMTANAFEEDKQDCIAHRMNAHLAKPFKPDELVRKLYECLK